MNNKKKLTLEFPENMTESDFYPVKRKIGNKEDVINIFVWNEEDIIEMEEYAKKVRKSRNEEVLEPEA